jgi:hypothetical protein
VNLYYIPCTKQRLFSQAPACWKEGREVRIEARHNASERSHRRCHQNVGRLQREKAPLGLTYIYEKEAPHGFILGNRKSAVIAGLIIFCLAAASSCRNGRPPAPDPKFVEAFNNADAVLGEAPNVPEGDGTYGGKAAMALDSLMKEIINQNDKYINVRQKNDLKNLLMQLGEIYAHAENLGFNPGRGSLDSLGNEWQQLKPQFAQFVGKGE